MLVVGLEREGLSKLASIDGVVQKGYRNGLTKGGFFLEGKVVRKINSNLAPALKDATIQKKDSSKSLIDSGEMRSEVTSKGALGGDAVEVGIFGGRADVAVHHEFGAPSAGIPERSFLRSTAHEEDAKIFGIVAKEIDKAIKKK